MSLSPGLSAATSGGSSRSTFTAMQIRVRVQSGLGNRLQHKWTHAVVLFFSGKHQEERRIPLQYHKFAETRQFVQRGHETSGVLLAQRPQQRRGMGQRRRIDLLLHQQYEKKIRRLLFQPVLHP